MRFRTNSEDLAYVLGYEQWRIVLLSGKSTGNLGVVKIAGTAPGTVGCDQYREDAYRHR